MEFHNHLSHELVMPQYVEQQLAAGTPAMLRNAIDQLTAARISAATAAGEEEDGTGDGKDFHRFMDGVGKPVLVGESGPTWLSNAILQQHGQGSFLHLQTVPEADDSPGGHGGGEGLWFPRPPILRSSGGEEEVPVSSDSIVAAAMSSGGGEGSGVREIGEPEVLVQRGSCGATAEGTWQNARYKAEILSHPLYEQLLSAHVACLRIATPVDQLPRIDAQLAQSQQVVSKYSALGSDQMMGDNRELDQFMTHYVLLLSTFKEQLQQHVRVHAMEAVMACWELEQSLQKLTGASSGEGTGATMSDDEDDQEDSDTNLLDGSSDGPDSMGFGPLVPTESERSLMERVRQELKHELKQGYKDKIVDIREEILRKRRAGKLPGDSTSTLKAWWQSHSKWPYPTVCSVASILLLYLPFITFNALKNIVFLVPMKGG